MYTHREICLCIFVLVPYDLLALSDRVDLSGSVSYLISRHWFPRRNGKDRLN